MIFRDSVRVPVLARAGRSGLAKILVLGILGLISFLCIFPVASRAHAFPTRSEPKVGATVHSSPVTVRIWFDCDLESTSSKLAVRNADNKIVDKNDSKVDASDPKLLEVSVPKLLPGRYRVMWSVVSRDGHHSNGDFMFRVK